MEIASRETTHISEELGDVFSVPWENELYNKCLLHLNFPANVVNQNIDGAIQKIFGYVPNNKVY